MRRLWRDWADWRSLRRYRKAVARFEEMFAASERPGR